VGVALGLPGSSAATAAVNGADAEVPKREEAGVGDTRESPPKLKEIASASGATRSGFRESGLPEEKGSSCPALQQHHLCSV